MASIRDGMNLSLSSKSRILCRKKVFILLQLNDYFLVLFFLFFNIFSRLFLSFFLFLSPASKVCLILLVFLSFGRAGQGVQCRAGGAVQLRQSDEGFMTSPT